MYWKRNSFLIFNTETEMSSGWQSYSSLVTLKASFDVRSDDHGSHPGDLSVYVNGDTRSSIEQ